MNSETICKTVPLHVLLRRRREQLRLRQSELAETLGVSPECIALWESGRRRMEFSKLPRIAQALRLDEKQLCIQGLLEFHPAVFQALFPDQAGIESR